MKRLLPALIVALSAALVLAACGAKQDKLTAAGAPKQSLSLMPARSTRRSRTSRS